MPVTTAFSMANALFTLVVVLAAAILAVCCMRHSFARDSRVINAEAVKLLTGIEAKTEYLAERLLEIEGEVKGLVLRIEALHAAGMSAHR